MSIIKWESKHFKSLFKLHWAHFLFVFFIHLIRETKLRTFNCETWILNCNEHVSSFYSSVHVFLYLTFIFQLTLILSVCVCVCASLPQTKIDTLRKLTVSLCLALIHITMDILSQVTQMPQNRTFLSSLKASLKYWTHPPITCPGQGFISELHPSRSYRDVRRSNSMWQISSGFKWPNRAK